MRNWSRGRTSESAREGIIQAATVYMTHDSAPYRRVVSTNVWYTLILVPLLICLLVYALSCGGAACGQCWPKRKLE